MTPSGIRPCSRRTASGSWPGILPRPSLRGSWRRPGSAASCPTSTSRSTGRLLRRGPSERGKNKEAAGSGPPPDDPGNPTVDFHGERRSNSTHVSTTDPDARLFRKGDAHEAKLYYQGHVV